MIQSEIKECSQRNIGVPSESTVGQRNTDLPRPDRVSRLGQKADDFFNDSRGPLFSDETASQAVQVVECLPAGSGKVSEKSKLEEVQIKGDLFFDKKISAAMNGDDNAFGQIAENLWNYLVFVAEQYHSPNLRSKFGASDIVQMSFMEARETLQDFRGQSTDEFRAWLRKIVVNNVRDETRRYSDTKCRDSSREVSLSGKLEMNLDLCHSEEPIDQLERTETDQQVLVAIQNLSPREREVIEARHQRDDQYQKIAQQLDIPKSAVRKIRFRAIQRLKNWFGRE